MDFPYQHNGANNLMPGPPSLLGVATADVVENITGVEPNVRADLPDRLPGSVLRSQLIENGFWLLQRTRNPSVASNYNNHRLLEAARQAGLTVRFVDMQEVPTGAPTYLLPRSGTRLRPHDRKLIATWERAGTRSLNPSDALSQCRDKAQMSTVLERSGCAMPTTRIITRTSELFAVVDDIGLPCVVKALRGGKGKGVQLCRDWNDLWSAFQSRRTQVLLVQTFIAEAAGRDTRVLVLDGEILGGMERFGPEGDFRSNAALGGPVRAATLSPDLKQLAHAATNAFGLRFAGVDLLLTRDGPMVCEVNSAPGFEAFETATGVRVAEQLLDALISN